MEKQFKFTVKGGGNPYSSPSIETIDISIEKGFGDSTLDYAAPGEAGNIEDGNNYDL